MAGSKILKESRVARKLQRTVTKAKNNSDSGKTNFQPEDIEIRRFKIHEPCNRCVYVTVCTNSAIKTKARIEIIVRDIERVRGSIAGQLCFREEEKIRKRGG